MVAEAAVREISYIQAFNEALTAEMHRDPAVIVMGEDVAGAGGREGFEDAWGGVMRLTKGLYPEFGASRVRDTPISEAGFIGAGVGAAATGLRPVVELMYVGFYGVCADQITNNAAKMHYMFGGKVNIPPDHICGYWGWHQLCRPALRDPLLALRPLPRAEVRRPVRPIHGERAAHLGH